MTEEKDKIPEQEKDNSQEKAPQAPDKDKADEAASEDNRPKPEAIPEAVSEKKESEQAQTEPVKDEKPKEEAPKEEKPKEEPAPKQEEPAPKEEAPKPDEKAQEAPAALAQPAPEAGSEKKRKKIKAMSPAEIDTKLKDVKEKMGNLKSRYAKQLLKQKGVLSKEGE
ncbi:hypothetical protein ACFL0T_01295 [Candidatus Omnitrophota bacterium]